ncbi:MAG: hypothetical protein BMS9Abin31_1200 [Gammaproteobacteria bacterium]|nr:MAG: hypothetical protein BMS9Abin31_1200 [Gammaproteobacteria bacterium]
MKNRKTRYILSFIFLLTFFNSLSYAVPPVTGSPRIDKPLSLYWEQDFIPANPDLTTPSTNMVFDLHAQQSTCDIVLSTAGNYHMALRQLWHEYFLPANPAVKDWFYTTSPPVAEPQIENGILTTGNWKGLCRPSIAVGPKGLMDNLDAKGFTLGERIPIIQNQGNVILVKNGNPKSISSVWDLGKLDINVVTSNPDSEPGSFGNYSGSIYNIALNQPGPGTADELFERIFGIGSTKWLAGQRIHHREVPWAIAYGHADAGLMFYHLAVFAKRSFPDLFDIIPLGGTVRNPEPLAGNKIGKLFAVRITGNWTAEQELYRENLLAQYTSQTFSDILASHGLLRPPEFVLDDTKSLP